ncbi:hypothetical protein KI688_010910 [Linnemannia hyalina]|uniref:Uncharacterized protein n=1 Tax=Linnemannia hyalina TaxID=64524 RepID=A0A9P8BUW0_9FUNG|nr:hypothetical protein KI688_010910 [Linnemannia hyalina]
MDADKCHTLENGRIVYFDFLVDGSENTGTTTAYTQGYQKHDLASIVMLEQRQNLTAATAAEHRHEGRRPHARTHTLTEGTALQRPSDRLTTIFMTLLHRTSGRFNPMKAG